MSILATQRQSQWNCFDWLATVQTRCSIMWIACGWHSNFSWTNILHSWLGVKDACNRHERSWGRYFDNKLLILFDSKIVIVNSYYSRHSFNAIRLKLKTFHLKIPFSMCLMNGVIWTVHSLGLNFSEQLKSCGLLVGRSQLILIKMKL